MLAIKECLIREGVLNLTPITPPTTQTTTTKLSNYDNTKSPYAIAVSGNNGGSTVTFVAGANNTNTMAMAYGNNHNNNNNKSTASGNNLRTISTNYNYSNYNNSYNNDNDNNRNNRNYDMASVLALDKHQLVATAAANLSDQQKSVDTTAYRIKSTTTTNTNNENQSSNCSLSSTSATATSSCQPTTSNKYYDKSKSQQQKQPQATTPTTGTSKCATRYHGVHPHFHHHTAPAYYTDVNLRIHTPKATDVAALNENYQSVYKSPSNLVNEHYFPKTSTATVVPPPIGTGTALIGRANTTSPPAAVAAAAAAERDKRYRQRSSPGQQQQQQQLHTSGSTSAASGLGSTAAARAAFFRGGSAVTAAPPAANDGAKRKSFDERFVRLSPAFGRAAKKGDLNDTTTEALPYDSANSSSFVIVEPNESSNFSSENNQIDNTVDTSYTTITFPTSTTGNTAATAAPSGRSRHSNRFAGKKRAVRLRSESRPISALYDIICKEKGLDIGTTSSSTSNDEDSSTTTTTSNANANNAHEGDATSRRSSNRNSKERRSQSRQRAATHSHISSRNSSLKTNQDYTEISNSLSAFVANSIAAYLGEEDEMYKNHTTNVDGHNDGAGASERSRRAHKSRTPSGGGGGKSSSSSAKKRSSNKEHGKVMIQQNSRQYAAATATASDDEPHAADSSEDSNELPRSGTHAMKLRSKQKRANENGVKAERHDATTNGDANYGVGAEKASSLPPRLYKHTPADSTRPYTLSSTQRLQNYHQKNHHHNHNHQHQHQHHQSPSLPLDHLSSSAGVSCSLLSPSTPADDGLILDTSLGSFPDKLYIEPLNVSSGAASISASASISLNASTANGKNANSSSSGIVADQTNSSTNSSAPSSQNQRVTRAQQRRMREEMRRHTDLPQLPVPDVLPEGSAEKALSEDEGFAAGDTEEKSSRSTKARRFINRPSRTPSRGRASGNSLNGSPHPVRRRGSSSQPNNGGNSSSASPSPSASPPRAANRLSTLQQQASQAPPAANSTSASIGVGSTGSTAVTIKNVGSASSAGHLAALIKPSPLDIMTNSSATPAAAELRPPTNGGGGSVVALNNSDCDDEGGQAYTTATTTTDAGSRRAGSNGISAAFHQRKNDLYQLHKAHSNTLARSYKTNINTTTATATTKSNITLKNKTPASLKERSPQRTKEQQTRDRVHQQQQQQQHMSNHSKICSPIIKNNYATPTETYLFKQKVACANGSHTNNSNIPIATCMRKKSLSPLVIKAMPSSNNNKSPTADRRKAVTSAKSPTTTTATTKSPTAHQLSHQHEQQQQQAKQQHQHQLSVSTSSCSRQRRQSPLSGAAPISPTPTPSPTQAPPLTRSSPTSPLSPHYVRTTRASRLRAAVLDKKKCEEEDALYQRNRSPTSPRPATGTATAASPKRQSSRRSASSPTDHPTRGAASTDSHTKLTNAATSLAVPSATTSFSDSPTAAKRLVLTMSVSVRQNISEMHFNGPISPQRTTERMVATNLRKQTSTNSTSIPTPSNECSAKFTRTAGRLSTTATTTADDSMDAKTRKPQPRPRSSTLKSSANEGAVRSSDGDEEHQLELSPVKGATPDSLLQDRDKSSKRKSNLNRSLNDEIIADSDDSIAARRRRRRELGMVRQLVPSNDANIRELLLPPQQSKAEATTTTTSTSSESAAAAGLAGLSGLASHMETARRVWDLNNPSARDRAAPSETASPTKCETAANITSSKAIPQARLTRRSDTLHLGELRKLRTDDINRKMNERTKSDLAEIRAIAEQANIEMAMAASNIATDLAELTVKGVGDARGAEASRKYGNEHDECLVELATSARYGLGGRSQKAPPTPSYTKLEVAAEAKEYDHSPAKHATFMEEERIYYEPETSGQAAKSITNATLGSGLLRQRILKARSMERDAGHEPLKLSPILRRRSTDDPAPAYVATMPTTASSSSIHSTSPSTATSHNHIVSILKKKDLIAGESSSASSNASPVTFSANVVDTPTTKQKRAGILKKRSSLDESRYYSRSHSPDERSILIKSARRNSLEEIAGSQQQQQQQQHGILKQSSYESSKSDGCPSATEPHPHGILKKKDSTSTPSDGGASHAPKHVSISQAVKMAAAELDRETSADAPYSAAELNDESGYTPNNNEDFEIRPILKLDSTSSDDAVRPPKPILKKKSSGDSDELEIRPILKTSRKSSREEFDLTGGGAGNASLDDEESTAAASTPVIRPILKTDSPSKRRSLGSGGGSGLLTEGADDQDVFHDGDGTASDSAATLLKRRTRSLERQEAPLVDLAEALNAIATSQAAPVEFVSTPVTTGGRISVAERIRNMEKFLNSAGTSPNTPTSADAPSSWESPLQTGMTPRLLKPSAIKRDMYRDRYKTQPVTNDEKLLFKATASPLDTSAFKPTKSLDIGLNYTTFAQLNAPSAASSNSPSSTFALTPSATQPLYSNTNNAAASGVGTPSAASSTFATPPLRNPYTFGVGGHLNSLSIDTPPINYHNNNISEQLTLSLGSDSERIFEMSGIGGDDSNLLAKSKTEVTPRESGGGGSSLSRQNSVRARANMFQQLQEQNKKSEVAAAAAATSSSAAAATTPVTALSREERTSPRRTLHQLSPALATPPPIMTSSLGSHEESSTPKRSDEEIEPTSLPVSERLRFFAKLTAAANRSATKSTRPSSRYLTTERCSSANAYSHKNSFNFTPRSSYNDSGSASNSSAGTSSASVTPTPMDCCYSPPICESQLISINEIDSALRQRPQPNPRPRPADRRSLNVEEIKAPHVAAAAPMIGVMSNVDGTQQHETSAFIRLTKSRSQTTLPSVVAQRMAMTSQTPSQVRAQPQEVSTMQPNALTPVARRIKMKAIGKLMLPQTFLNNERNTTPSPVQCQSQSNSGNNSSCVYSNDSGDAMMNGHNEHNGHNEQNVHNEQNGHNEHNSNNNNNDACDSSESVNIETNSLGGGGGKLLAITAPMQAPKKIGKIRSPFIENCLQMQQKQHLKCMKYDHKSTPHNALAALENNANVNGLSGHANGGAERDMNTLYTRKPLQNGNAAPSPPPTRADSYTELKSADTGKENNYVSMPAPTPQLTVSPAAGATPEPTTHTPVVEMRKKFARIMSGSTLTTAAKRHTAYGISLSSALNGNGSGASPSWFGGNSSGLLNGSGGCSSAPTTPRNSIIDEKYAKYFGLTSGGGAGGAGGNNSSTFSGLKYTSTPTTTTTATTTATPTIAVNNKAVNGSAAVEHKPVTNGAHVNTQITPAQLQTPRLTTPNSANKCAPALPPLDFAQALNVDARCAAGAGHPMTHEIFSTPLEAFNRNVRSSANTPYYTPPSAAPAGTSIFHTPATPMSAVNGNAAHLAVFNPATTTATASGAATNSAQQRRRDMAKRQRANTTNITYTPTTSARAAAADDDELDTPPTSASSSSSSKQTPNTGRARALRVRARTLTHGVPPLPEVKRFEDIVVTIEEFQSASKEFERIFLGVI